MLIFTATLAGAEGARCPNASRLCAAAVLLFAATFSYAQPVAPAGAAPGGPGFPAPPPGAAGAFGPAPPIDDGIPPPNGRSDEAELPTLVKRPKLSDKAPRPAADPRNFEGVWYHFGSLQARIVRDMYGVRLSYTEEARKILRHRREMENAGKPLTNAASQCYPSPTWNFEIHAPFHVVQTDELIYFVFQEFHAVWQIRMNRQHRTSGEREFNGDAVGRWDGDTLVVDTVNFKEPLWLDPAGTPASRDVRLTHRIRKLEDGTSLEIITTVNDPSMYSTPWSFARSFAWAPNSWMLGEYNCEQQVGASGGTSYGLFEDERAPQ